MQISQNTQKMCKCFHLQASCGSANIYDTQIGWREGGGQISAVNIFSLVTNEEQNKTKRLSRDIIDPCVTHANLVLGVKDTDSHDTQYSSTHGCVFMTCKC